MTLKEIAQKAGVSISTVSRVLNKKNTNAASPEVQNRIWKIVRDTGYTPNKAAQSLKSGQNFVQADAARSIACVFARTKNSTSDPFFSQLARHVEQAAYQNEFVVRFMYNALDIRNPGTIRTLLDHHVEGVVILGRCSQQLLQTLKQHFKNIIYCGLNALNAKCDQVICDGLESSKAAVNYLCSLGHEKIGYIGETENETRYNGYLSVLKEHRLSTSSKHVANVLLSYDGGEKGAYQLIKQAPDITAVFCANDLTAIGAMLTFQEMGLRIPEDISIISIDDIETRHLLNPMLTTVHIPLEEMGGMTAKLLIDSVNGGHHLPIYLSVPFTLVKRQSCAPLARP